MKRAVNTTDGSEVYTYKDISRLRDSDKKNRNSNIIYAQEGCQEKFLASNADITLFGGQRGGGKSSGLLLNTLYDIENKNLNAIIVRHEVSDLDDIINTSYDFYQPFGKYNRSKTDMTWNFFAGGSLKFSYYSDTIEEFKKRFQGKQFAFIGIDEITHMPYDKFKYLITCNRNAFGIRNRICGTCNPDPYSWVKIFIDWWIDQDGYPIDGRDGVIRYCFMNDDDPSTIYWGDTREEVYYQCRDIIDPLWKEAYKELGFDILTMFIKSVTFIRGRLEQNLILLSSDSNYVANLAQQGEEQRSRDLDGNWIFKKTGDDIITSEHMAAFYNNTVQKGDAVNRASADVALEGGDKCVLYYWRGDHIQDIFVCQLNAKHTVQAISGKLDEWKVAEENFTYDLNGLGQLFKGFFVKAVPFNNTESVDDKYKSIYANLKSQCAYIFAQKLIAGEISINQTLLERKYSGRGYKNQPLKDILNIERKCIRQTEESSDRGFTLITKKAMKLLIGHSPDFIESMMMKEIFHVKKRRARPSGLGFLGIINN